MSNEGDLFAEAQRGEAVAQWCLTQARAREAALPVARKGSPRFASNVKEAV